MTLRMIADKVYTGLDSYFSSSQIETLKRAGFNVICNVQGRYPDDTTASEALAERCREKGVYYAPWMRWTYNTTTDAEKFTSSGGTKTALASPTSTTLWNYIGTYLTAYSEMASRVSSVWGLFIDLEVYSVMFDNPDNVSLVKDDDDTRAYAYSYSDNEFTAFCIYAGLACPDPIPDDRGGWLDTEGEHDNYKVWLKAQVASKFESELDTVLGNSSSFTVGIWAASDNYFVRACIDSFNSKGLPSPVVFSNKYAQGNRTLMGDMAFLYQDESAEHAEWSARGARLVTAMMTRSGAKYRWPYNLAQSARMGQQATNGYWIWFETTDAPAQRYMDAFATISKNGHWSDDLVDIW